VKADKSKSAVRTRIQDGHDRHCSLSKTPTTVVSSLATVASIAVGIVPIWVLETWFSVPREIRVGDGILAYVIGTTLLKLPLHPFCRRADVAPPAAAAGPGRCPRCAVRGI